MVRYVSLSIAALSILSSVPAAALTLKSGEVIGSDGNVYAGASPENTANLKGSGVVGRNLFIEVNGKVTFVPLIDLAGKSKEMVKDIIISAILTGGKPINQSDAEDVEQIDTQAQTLIENVESATAGIDLDAAVAAYEAGVADGSIDPAKRAHTADSVDLSAY